MAMNFDSNNLTIPRGKVFFARFLADTQTPGHFVDLGNCPDFTLSREVEKLIHHSSQQGFKRRDKDLVYNANIQATVKMDDMSFTNRSLWMMSDVMTLTGIAATGVVEVFSGLVNAAGKYIQLGRSDTMPTGIRNPTAVVVTQGVTVFTLGTDYELEADLGLIRPLGTGTINFATALTVTYNVPAQTRRQLAAGIGEIEGELKVIAQNPLGQNMDYTIPRCILSPDGDLSLIQDPDSTAYQTIGLNIEALQKGSLALLYVDGRATLTV